MGEKLLKENLMVKWRRIWTTEVPTFHRQGKWSTKKQVAPWNYSSSSLLSEIMPHLSSVLKSRDITLPKKVCIIKAVVFPVVMYGVSVGPQRRLSTEEFMLLNWCWRRLLRVPWTARRSNHSILKEITPEYSLEGLMLKLKLQYFVHLMQRADSLEKTLMPEKIEDRRDRWQRIRRLDSITRVLANSGR